MILYNTLTREKEQFKPSKGRIVNLYTCGPTVYDHAHIGNLRSYIAADMLRRVLKYNGYDVRWVMNITDVDDKTIKRTVDEFGPKATPKDLRAYTDRYIAQFKKDLAAVNIPTDSKPLTFIRVSDVIEDIIIFIKKLMKLGYAYKTDDGVYFSIETYQKKFGDYGALVGKNFLKGKKVGARVKVDDYTKDNLSDFALWKARDASDGNIFWSDPELGEGRPGWHIECSVINELAFGDSGTDIHTGGVDLIFPHHTNEIAQSQSFGAAQDKPHPFVRHWFHSEHLLVDGKKMAKREKNFYTLADLEKEIPNAGMALRYLALQTHYRTPMNFTMEALLSANNALKNLKEKIDRIKINDSSTSTRKWDDTFLKTINSDLNTALALSTLQSVFIDKFSPKVKLGLIKDFNEVLGLKALEMSKDVVIPSNIKKLIAEREAFRRNKQFIQSDDLRKKINDLGYEIEDTSTGTLIFHAGKSNTQSSPAKHRSRRSRPWKPSHR